MKTKKYDKTIKVDDIVTGWYKGYFRVTDITKRKDRNPVVSGVLILDSNGNPAKSEIIKWDISYSKKITPKEVQEIIDYDLEFFVNKKKNLLNLFKK